MAGAEMAVGGLSLGLQVCKGLITYLDDVKGADEQIAEVEKRMEKLAAHLESVESVVQKMEASAGRREKNAGWVMVCKDALEKTKSKFSVLTGEGGGTNGSGSGKTTFSVRMKTWKKRLLFPLKQGDFKFCKEVIGSIQQDLNTALAILISEQQAYSADAIKTQLAMQSEVLEQIHNKNESYQQVIVPALRDHCTSIQSAVHRISADNTDVLRSDISEVRTAINPLTGRMEQLSLDVSTVRSILENQITDVNLQRLFPKGPQDEFAKYADGSQRMEQAQIPNDSPSKRKGKTKNTNSLAFPQNLSCTCHTRSQTTVYLSQALHLSHTLTTLHHPPCPLSTLPSTSTMSNLHLRFSLCSLALKRKIHFAIALSRGLGSTSLLPALRSYRVVDAKTSPAFRLMATFGRRIGDRPDERAWEVVARKLWKVFEEGKASPYDRLANGWSLLHVSSPGHVSIFL
ncbi:uncharacterized protein EI97DRAFT_242083 [Westerdykella ornata]|uniref:Fungal N-terminal domain-containing protein n=1 Tax=Westerdykella ornata TaxID=318751 RepID=A0A6A6J6U5_WESOR|nr:uncharacterized protein EI97DRAFT_242083 [Westerdykella ornata]KAF2271873.1 hypothetical protein EI97DRAFT_242083 [Westerdykella ornata]